MRLLNVVVFPFVALRWPLLLSFAGALLAFGLNLGSAGPMIQGDEGGYLANAAAIAGYRNDLASSYHAGYSILLSPAFLFGFSPTRVWMLVKLINAALYGLSLLCLWLISRRLFPETPVKGRLSGIVLVGLYPMWVVMVGYAFAQTAFAPGYLLVVILFLLALEKHSCVRTVFLGAVAGGLYWIHPVAAPVIAALFVASAYWSVVSQRRAFFVHVTLGVSVSFSVYRWIFQPWLHDRMTLGGAAEYLHYPALGALLQEIITAEGLHRLVSVVGGHVFYLVAGTGGLVFFAVVFLVRWLPKAPFSEMADPKRGAISLLLLGSFVGALCLSVVAMSQPERLDHWLYGRYVEGVLAPMLLVAVFSVRATERYWPLLVTLAAAAMLVSGLVGYGHTAPFNVSTFWQEFLLRTQGPYVWVVAGVAVLSLLLYLPRHLALAGLTLFFVANTGLQLNYHAINSKGARQRVVAGEVVRQMFPPGTCVGLDRAELQDGLKMVFRSDLGFLLYDYPMTRIDVKTWYDTCRGPIFSFEADLHEGLPGVLPLARTPGGGPTVYVKAEDAPADLFDVYPLRLNVASAAATRLLGRGWHGQEPNNVWSKASAVLNLPVPQRCRQQPCRFVLQLAPYGASPKRPVDIWVRDAGDVTASAEPTLRLTSEAAVELKVAVRDVSVQVLRIEVPSAISPKDLRGGADPRVLGVGLRAVDLQLIEGTN